jgi:hypothetical protein
MMLNFSLYIKFKERNKILMGYITTIITRKIARYYDSLIPKHELERKCA